MAVWKQLEPTATHLTYIVLSSFLIVYALFELFIKNRLHLSEPPLATLFGIIFGPAGAGVLDPRGWGLDDVFVQEFTRIILGVQCFTVGVDLPAHYFNGHWKSVAMMLGPVMAFGWIVCAVLIYLLVKVDFTVALIIAACLTPTDPVLAASVLSNSQFSTRIPKRIRHLLSAESGCNDGVSFPFIYVGLSVLTRSTVGGMLKKWFLITVLYQCVVGILMGLFVGHCANRILRFSDSHDMVGRGSYLVFYILLSIFSIGLASTLGIDDFLVAFSAGIGFANDGWFSKRVSQSKLPLIVDLLLNSTMFVYFGAQIPWSQFQSVRNLSPGLLFGLLVLVLLLRRIPIVLLLKRWVPDIHTYREALFCGHFGPIGVAALFLAIEARAQLENDSSEPLPEPPHDLPHRKQHAIDVIWPVICFIVLGSTMVHGLSTLVISIFSHYSRHSEERAPLIGAETDPLSSMRYGEEDEEEDDD